MNINSVNFQNYFFLDSFDKAPPIVKKIGHLGIRFFPLLCSVGLISWGIKELLIDTSASQTPSQRIKNSVDWFFEKIKLYSSPQERPKYVLHGIFFLGSGMAGIASEFNLLGYSQPLQAAGNLLFVMGNVVSLELNIRKYLKASEILNRNNEDPSAAALMKSASLGILNSLGYIICAAMMLYGYSTAILLLVGGFGSIFGCIKILFDLVNDEKLRFSRQ